MRLNFTVDRDGEVLWFPLRRTRAYLDRTLTYVDDMCVFVSEARQGRKIVASSEIRPDVRVKRGYRNDFYAKVADDADRNKSLVTTIDEWNRWHGERRGVVELPF